MDAEARVEALDAILALQLEVAWAGEGGCRPPRLGWWRTDLVDPDGGGDLLARLLPKTHEWAALEAVREAARRRDRQMRSKMSDPDNLRTLFFFGFVFDERLDERLHALKFTGTRPSESLPINFTRDSTFSADMFAERLTQAGAKAAHTIVPNGRQLKGPRPDDPLEMATNLTAALVPLVDQYPMPFYKVK